MLDTAWWQQFLTFPPCGLGRVHPKACQRFDQSWHLHPLSVFDQREPAHSDMLSLGWAQSLTGKHRPARSLEGGIAHFILTLAPHHQSKVPASFPTQRNPCWRSHPCVRPWQTDIYLRAPAPSPTEAYKAGRGNLGDARRRVKEEALAPAEISISSSLGRVFPEGMGEVEVLARGSWERNQLMCWHSPVPYWAGTRVCMCIFGCPRTQARVPSWFHGALAGFRSSKRTLAAWYIPGSLGTAGSYSTTPVRATPACSVCSSARTRPPARACSALLAPFRDAGKTGSPHPTPLILN